MKNALLVSLSGASLECRKEGGETQGEGEEKISTLVMFLTKGGGGRRTSYAFVIDVLFWQLSSLYVVYQDILLIYAFIPTSGYVFVYRRTMCSCTDELCVRVPTNYVSIVPSNCVFVYRRTMCSCTDELCVRVPTNYLFVYRRTICSCTDELGVRVPTHYMFVRSQLFLTWHGGAAMRSKLGGTRRTCRWYGTNL